MEKVNKNQKNTGILRFPRLDTILMAEKFIQNNSWEYNKLQLWKQLPKKMMYQTYRLIIDYLLYSGKIFIDAQGMIGWIQPAVRIDDKIKNKELLLL
ncbi:MAG: hypothetical protein KKG59_04385 [Nanoarchaeota archaeon]|nr:hypothetical protein [Nanoarchaeota archaeon]